MLKERKISRFMVVAFLAALLALPSLALALSLDEAKGQGLVGERQDGYLGIVVANPSAEVRQLVGSVNAKRREEYLAIAQRTGSALGVVEALAAKKAHEKTRPGNLVQSPGGEWQRK